MKRLPAATSEFVNLINLHRKHSPSGRACCETLFSWSWEVKHDEKLWDFQWFSSLSSPQWSHLFPKTGVSVIESFPLFIQAVRYKPVKFPRSEVFQCHDCTKKQSFHQPISTESTATPPSLPRFLQPFSSIRWKAVRVASSQWKNSAPAYVSGERTVKQRTRMFCKHVFFAKRKMFRKKASEAPNSLRH